MFKMTNKSDLTMFSTLAKNFILRIEHDIDCDTGDSLLRDLSPANRLQVSILLFTRDDFPTDNNRRLKQP